MDSKKKKKPGLTVQRALAWLLVLVIGLALVRLVPWSAYHQELNASWPGNAPRLIVLDVVCTNDAGMPRAEVQVRNAGKKVVESPTGAIRFAEETQEGRFVPDSIPPGGQATMTVYATTNKLGNCELLQVEDREGRKATLANLSRFNNPNDRIQILQ